MDTDQSRERRETIYNPLSGEEVTLLQRASDANGHSAVVEIRLPPRGKGPPLHYHTGFDETFKVVEGELVVRVGAQTLRLRPGQQATAAAGQHHTFWSETDAPVRFLGTVTPGSLELENCFRISFGLARDGLCNAKGVPRNPYHLAILASMSQSRAVGVLSAVMWLLERLATTPRGRSIQQELIRKYCPGANEAVSAGGVTSRTALD